MKVKIIETGQIKTVLGSVGRMLIEQGEALDAEHEHDPESQLVRDALGQAEEKKVQKETVEVIHRHIIEEEE